MKNIILCITLYQILFLTSINGQIYKPTEAKIYQSLIGEIYILSLFVDTREDTWEENEINYFISRLEKSQAWLQEEAEYFEQELEFINDYFFENNQVIYLENVQRGQNPKYTINKIMEKFHYENLEDFFSQNLFDFKKKKLKLLLFVKSNDRSHAYNYWSNSDLDLAIIYCKSTYGMTTTHFTISHEVLHQFGAWDLYYGKSQSLEKAEKAKELYPNSIMINTWTNHALLEVDELTAWRVGWHVDFKEEYLSFTPVRKNRSPKKTTGGTSIKFDFKKTKKNKEEGD